MRGVWGEPSWPPEAVPEQRRPGRRVADPISDRVGYPAQIRAARPAFQAMGLTDVAGSSAFTECETGELFIR